MNDAHRQRFATKTWQWALVVDLPDAASVVFVNLSSLLRSSSTKERGDQEQDQGNREDGPGLLSAQVTKVPLALASVWLQCCRSKSMLIYAGRSRSRYCS